ncbi:MAG: polyphosphate kinase 1 [Acidimicrobiales bacterium]
MDGDPGRFINRELSWLEFDERVLAIAADPTVPPLERAKFLAIFSQNLDEFFQVRAAGLLDQVEAGVADLSPDGLTASQQMTLISGQVAVLTRRADGIFLNELVPALAEAGVRFCQWNELDDADQKFLRAEFDRRIFPILTPLAVDPGHPFPDISNLSLNLAIRVHDPEDGEQRFARLKLPASLPRFFVTEDRERLVPLEQVISAHLDRLFCGMVIDEHQTFRVTRNADLDLEEEDAEDLLEAVEIEVRRRRFGTPVRLEVPAAMSDEMVDLLQRELEMEDEQVHRHAGPLDLAGLWSVYALDRPDLKFPVALPVDARAFTAANGVPGDFFSVLRRGDVLVHHPYESFTTSVEEFIHQAANDRHTQAIKVTLYRTSGDSAIIASLIRAAEAGKQVVALVELKARFDEENNIEWARRLERSGVHVVYGLVGLKTHTKIVMVARAEGDAVRAYCHVGTGNYNARTARTYEDFGLFTAANDVAIDVQNLFNFLTGYSRDVSYLRLLVAPDHMRSDLVGLIRGERPAPVGHTPRGEGHITMKMNSLVDPDMIDELYAAAADGVRIDLIVRGICCLRPQVPGLSETIRVRSLVGRYLEHSRVYRFANGAGYGRPSIHLGSADLMPRNLDRRVEALITVVNPTLLERLDDVLSTQLTDDMLAWSLTNDTWRKVPTVNERDSQLELHDMARTWASQGR